MKTRLVDSSAIKAAGRWDIDFHLPPVEIQKFDQNIVVPVSDVAHIVSTTFDPTCEPETVFKYVDIASIDVVTGTVANPQEVVGEEAPSRARKIIRAYDIVISTCRPTRGAIAVVPESLHGEICSTGFSVLRPKADCNPIYLHFVLRLPSTLEQFRKWSTGSSYPAILDEDVSKTRIPVPSKAVQDEIASKLLEGLQAREQAILKANQEWNHLRDSCTSILQSKQPSRKNGTPSLPSENTCEAIQARLAKLELPRRELLAAELAKARKAGRKSKGQAEELPLLSD